MEKNVQVAVRCRPLNDKEKKASRATVVLCKPKQNEVSLRKKTYTFDKVYGPYSTQKELFKSTVQPVVDEALDGYNCTVFAYGQTGTGKTHTIQGSLNAEDEMAGIIPRAVRYVFNHLQQNYQDYSVRVSYLQLYNEELSDLLATNSTGKKLRLMEDIKKGGIYCQNLEEIPVVAAKDVFQLLERGVKNRHTAETALNENSSRSHSIFTIRLHTKEAVPGGEDLLRTGTLNLVDLAGSECIGRSGARHTRAREAGNINQSLLTLGRVITALVDKHPHVPYRDSKLTRLLQESLGGKAKTTIIATLAPCADCIDETISTLDYANRAKNIKNRPEANQRLTKHALLKDYGQEIESLRDALQAARDKDGIFLPPSKFQEMQERLSGQAVQIEQLEEAMEEKKLHLEETISKLEEREAERSQLRKNLEATEMELQETKGDLEETKLSLEATKKELGLAQQNLKLYQDNEKVLIQRGEDAKSIYEASRKENFLLRAKIDHKDDLEGGNKSTLKSFESQEMEQMQLLLKKMDVFKTQMAGLFAETSTSITAVSQLQEQNANKLKENILQVQENILSVRNTMKKNYAVTLHYAETNCKDLLWWKEQLSTSLQQQTAEMTSLIENSTVNLLSSIASGEEEITNSIASVNGLLENGLESAMKFAEVQSNVLENLEQSVTAAVEKQVTLQKQQQDNLLSFKSTSSSKLNADMVILQDSIATILEKFVASTKSTISGECDNLVKQSISMQEDIMQFADANRVAVEKSVNDIAQWSSSAQADSENLISKTTMMEESMKENLNSTNDLVSRFGAEQSVLNRTYVESIEEKSTRLSSMATEIRDQASTLGGPVNDMSALVAEKMVPLCESISSHIQENKADADEALENISTKVNNISSEVQDEANVQTQNHKQQNQRISDFATSLKWDTEEKLKVAVQESFPEFIETKRVETEVSHPKEESHGRKRELQASPEADVSEPPRKCLKPPKQIERVPSTPLSDSTNVQ